MYHIKEMWRNLLFAMSEGDILKMQAIEGMSIFDFWPYFDRWKEKIEQKKDNLKNNQQHGRRK